MTTKPEGANISFLTRDGDGKVCAEYLLHVSKDGVLSDDNVPIPPATLVEIAPALLGVHYALFGGDE